MSRIPFSKAQWVELFRVIGLDAATMQHWHHAFEHAAPDAHQSFLEWLAVPAQQIDEIRAQARAWVAPR